jgi:hypothetical protein
MAAVAHRQGEYHPPSSRQGGSSGAHHHSSGAGTVVRKKTSSSQVMRRDDAKMIGQWRIGRTIGKGSSGRCRCQQPLRRPIRVIDRG